MQIGTFINPNVPCLEAESTIAEALNIMDQTEFKALPVVSEEKLVAFVTENNLLDAPDDSLSLQTVFKNILPPFVLTNAHPYEAAVLMASLNIRLLPVIDEKEKYSGAVTLGDLFNYFFGKSSLTRPGGIIILEMMPMDYSLSEIARICESCDATILNVQTFAVEDSALLEVTIKVNIKELQALKAAFERYEYTIKEIFGMLPSQDDLIDRYRLLMNYINM